MTKRISGLFAILFCATVLVSETPTTRDKSALVENQADSSHSTAADPEDLRTDLQKMRTLLGQMQRNAAFVSAGDTPLKHQFELEIEMWQVLLRDMERKVNGSNAAGSQ